MTRTFSALRVVAVLHAIGVFLQPVLAGVYLSGEPTSLTMHSANAGLVNTLSLVLLVLAVLARRSTRTTWPVVGAAALAALEAAQQGFGFARLNVLHIPVGVAVVLGAVWYAIAILQPRREAVA